MKVITRKILDWNKYAWMYVETHALSLHTLDALVSPCIDLMSSSDVMNNL